MTPGPDKNFDPDEALRAARDVFWQHGYDGTAIRELESVLGIGRKSLYDTYGDKRTLYLRALAEYTDTVIARICNGLEDSRNGPLENLERVMNRLQEHHGSGESQGCLLGVAMAQADRGDEELAGLLRSYLRRLERAFERTIREAQSREQIRNDIRALDAARNLVALTQGMALMGRISETVGAQRSIVRAALQALRP